MSWPVAAQAYTMWLGFTISYSTDYSISDHSPGFYLVKNYPSFVFSLILWYSLRLSLWPAILSAYFFNVFLPLLTLIDVNTAYYQLYISSLHLSPCSITAFLIVYITCPFGCTGLWICLMIHTRSGGLRMESSLIPEPMILTSVLCIKGDVKFSPITSNPWGTFSVHLVTFCFMFIWIHEQIYGGFVLLKQLNHIACFHFI